MAGAAQDWPGRLSAAATAWRDELVVATIFLTRLPIRWPHLMPPDAYARSLALFPVVGAGIGLAGGAVLALGLGLGLPPLAAAVVAVAAQVVLTGALHEDGLGDTADGLGGGWNREERLAIMRDSRVGSYGSLALILAVVGRVSALAALAAAGGGAGGAAALAAAGAGSRGVLPLTLRLLPPARSEGLAAAAGGPSAARAYAALALGAGIALVAAGPLDGIVALIAGGVAAAALAVLAWRRIGGVTGDVLGGCQQLAEIAMLMTLAARP